MDRCELDPQKVCDNCFRCLEVGDEAYIEIPIAGVYLEDDFLIDEPAASPRRTHVQTIHGMYAERIYRR